MTLNEWQLIGIILILVGAVYAWLRFEQRRQAKNLHDLRNAVGRVEIWVTVIREKLGIGPRGGDDT